VIDIEPARRSSPEPVCNRTSPPSRDTDPDTDPAAICTKPELPAIDIPLEIDIAPLPTDTPSADSKGKLSKDIIPDEPNVADPPPKVNEPPFSGDISEDPPATDNAPPSEAPYKPPPPVIPT
jgi:hypothetical protein